MSEPTTTLAALRRIICKELSMPFFQRYAAGHLTSDSTSTVSALVDATLGQPEDYWNRAWVYRTASQEAALILDWQAGDHKALLESPITTLDAADYEIHSTWNALEIHEAINQAIRDSRRVFPETITDETLIVQEDTLTYALSALARVPYLIHKVWLEQPTTAKRGTAVAGGATSITLENAGILTGVDTNWKISIYAGPGAGQIRSVASVAGAQVNVAAWATQPTNASKYTLWNPAQQLYDWVPWTALRYDSTKEFPDYLYFSARPVAFLGLRIRLEYSSLPVELTTEDSATPIPESYLMPAAVSILHGRAVGDNKSDRELHYAEWRRYKEIAMAWMAQNAPHLPDTTLLSQAAGSYQPPADNPLDWGN